MFDIGFAEMLIIGIVALLVIGPERLPTVARTAGTYIGRIKRFVSNVRTDVEREFRTEELQRMLQQQQSELNTLRDAVNETRQEADLDSIENTIRDTGKDIVDDQPAVSDKSRKASAAETETDKAS